MKGYSWSKEDFREILYSKYRSMGEAIFIEGDSCSKCYMIKPYIQKRCEENGYELKVFRFDDINVKEFQIDSVPMLILKENNIIDQILTEEDIVHLISNSKKDVSISKKVVDD